jgi:2,5-dihydroxypyridine 5,6-dioxygenase
MHIMELSRGAKKIIEICGNIKAGEKVLILTDTGISSKIPEVLAAAAKAVGAEVTIITTSPGKNPGEEPNPVVAAAMAASDIIISPTTRTVYHSLATKKALESGARLISLTEISEKILVSGGIEADFIGLQTRVNHVKELFEKGKKVHVTTEKGTDLHLDITDRPTYACTGLCHEPGIKIGIPELEVFTAPIEESTNGILVVDACSSGIGLIENPIKLTIENGRVVSIDGGVEAHKLKQILESAKSEAAYIIAEFAIGLNDKAKVIGDIIEDEGAYGTGHFAVGNNIYFGGVNNAPIHLDMVYWHPTIEIDGETIMKKGELIEQKLVL